MRRVQWYVIWIICALALDHRHDYSVWSSFFAVGFIYCIARIAALDAERERT